MNMHDTLLFKCTLVHIHNHRDQKNSKPNENYNQKRKKRAYVVPFECCDNHVELS